MGILVIFKIGVSTGFEGGYSVYMYLRYGKLHGRGYLETYSFKIRNFMNELKIKGENLRIYPKGCGLL